MDGRRHCQFHCEHDKRQYFPLKIIAGVRVRRVGNYPTEQKHNFRTECIQIFKQFAQTHRIPRTAIAFGQQGIGSKWIFHFGFRLTGCLSLIGWTGNTDITSRWSPLFLLFGLGTCRPQLMHNLILELTDNQRGIVVVVASVGL